MSQNSDSKCPTQAAVRTYVAAQTSNINANTVSASGNATFSGNVSIGGTLTYEDVTNVDAVGLITARSGIKINTGEILVGAGASISAVDGGTVVGILTCSTLKATTVQEGGKSLATMGKAVAMAMVFG